MRYGISMPVAGPLRIADALVAALIVAAFAKVLMAFGRPPICPCGTVELWHGGANDSGTSQHVADWYALSHVIHGFLFYGAAVWIFARFGRPLPLASALFAALVIEGGWELLENSPMIIERYRAATVSDAYGGDSVLNSVSDMGFMTIGFFLARVGPVWLIVTAAIAMELLALTVIRDNLTLNVLMIVHPFDAIKAWQAAR